MGILNKIFSGGETQKLISEIEELIDHKKYDSAKEKVDTLLNKDDLNKKINYYAGIIYYNLGEYTKSDDHFKFAEDEFPKSNFYLGVINSHKKDFKKSINYFEKYTNQNNDVTALEYLASVYLKNRNFDKVLSVTEKLKSIRGDISSAYILAAETYLYQENPKKAVIEINKLLEFDHDNEIAHLLRGKAKTIVKEIDKAILDLETCLKLNKDNIEANFYMGICYSSKKDYEKALKYLDSALESEIYQPALELRSELKLAQDDPDSALKDIEALISYNPKSTKFLLKSADLKLKLNDLDGAKNDLSKILVIEQDNVVALYKLSKLEFSKKNFKLVIKYLTRAIGVEPSADIILLRGRTFYHIKDFQSAIKDLSKVIELNPELYSAYFYRAKVKEELKDNYGAITDYTKALNDQKFTDAYYSRGKLRLALKEYNAAAKDFSKAINLKSNEAVYYYLRAQCYNFMEKPHEALEDLDKAVQIKANFAQAYLLRGMVGFSNRSFSKAKSDFEKVVEIDKRYELHVGTYLTKIKEKLS